MLSAELKAVHRAECRQRLERAVAWVDKSSTPKRWIPRDLFALALKNVNRNCPVRASQYAAKAATHIDGHMHASEKEGGFKRLPWTIRAAQKAINAWCDAEAEGRKLDEPTQNEDEL